ncbi:MAG: hypothetical protein JXB39_16800 [Deltaproteobacteria bacterium]|nr:hypothetical protein [Deltaproteobacteria bacterium]
MTDPGDEADLKELEARMRAELEQEHARRIEEFQRRREDAHERGADHREQKRTEKLTLMKAEVRRRFYEEKGYQRYTDSRGQETWLPPEEYAWRMRVRRSRSAHHREYRPPGFLTGRKRTVLLYVILVASAVLVGLLVALRG